MPVDRKSMHAKSNKPGGGPKKKPAPTPARKSTVPRPVSKPGVSSSIKPKPAPRPTPGAAGSKLKPAGSKPSAGASAGRPNVVGSKPKPSTSKPPAGVSMGRPGVTAAAGAAAVGAAAAAGAAMTAEEIDSQLHDLAQDVTFADEKQAVADLEGGIADLQEQVAHVRSRGYRFKNFLERKLETLEKKWREAEPTVRRELNIAENELSPMYDRVARSRNPRQVADLRARVDAASSSINAAFSNVRQTFYQTSQQIKEVVWLFEQLDEASFDLASGENPVQAVEAEWVDYGSEEPEGVLYLTDQRVIFEQKQKVATKKVLFVTTESEMVQEMLLETPVSTVGEVKTSKKGVLGGKKFLEIGFSGGNYVVTKFQIKGQDNEAWASLVKRVVSGDISQEQFYFEGESPEAEQAALEEAFAEAPTQCSSCGAPVEVSMTASERQVTCEYCGTIMRW